MTHTMGEERERSKSCVQTKRKDAAQGFHRSSVYKLPDSTLGATFGVTSSFSSRSISLSIVSSCTVAQQNPKHKHPTEEDKLNASYESVRNSDEKHRKERERERTCSLRAAVSAFVTLVATLSVVPAVTGFAVLKK